MHADPTTSPASAPPIASQAVRARACQRRATGRHALGLEVGQLAALVAEVGHGPQDAARRRTG